MSTYCSDTQVVDFGITPAIATPTAVTDAVLVASAAIDDFCNGVELTPSTRTVTIDNVRRPYIVLPRPFATITAVTVNGTTVASTDYAVQDWGLQLFVGPVSVMPSRLSPYGSQVKVTATFGYASIPTTVRRACTLWAAAICLQSGSADSFVLGQVQPGPASRDRLPVQQWEALINQAQNLLMDGGFVDPGVG